MKVVDDGKSKKPFFLWGALGALIVGVAIFFAFQALRQISSVRKSMPFFHVTNREFSLFLWQNPEFMRRHASRKDGYLTGFERSGRKGIVPDSAEELVVAAPSVLFRYHTWKRLLGNERFDRKIDPKMFVKFLQDEPAWRPENWQQAPEGYSRTLSFSHSYDDLSEAQEDEMPWQVRQAYTGWLNYFEEGEAINEQQITVSQLRNFLVEHPEYKRNLWRNIVMQNVPDYLKILASTEDNQLVPTEQLTPFIRVALFNDAKKGR